MIRYSLRCTKDHDFDSWFQSAAAFERLQSAGLNACPICGSAETRKVLMAPAVRSARKAEAKPGVPDLVAPQSEVEAAITEMRRQLEENSDYVGMNFAAEARQMHEGAVPTRSIWGEVRSDEAKRLVEDGVPVAPLPFRPRRKTN